ncbi:hypothetical protein BD779DRAFT_1572510 [Infundibulicybe gibba]|nr:hypothetical protein BD779DRAFT_1572510 [Infundibulicybe gibba]
MPAVVGLHFYKWRIILVRSCQSIDMTIRPITPSLVLLDLDMPQVSFPRLHGIAREYPYPPRRFLLRQ